MFPLRTGRFPKETVLILITHGLALRIFLMRWFHWTVEQTLSIWNPENAEVPFPLLYFRTRIAI